MPQLLTAYDEQVTASISAIGTTSASYTSLTHPRVLAASMTAGKKYLVLARGEVRRVTISGTGGIRLLHGATEFSGSEAIFTSDVNTNDWLPWSFANIWTAVASEDLVLQVKSDGSGNFAMNAGCIPAINLSDNLTENTDWFSNESIANTTLTGTLQTGASITFTPAVGGERWLIITDARLEQDTTADYFLSRLDRTGGTAYNQEIQQAGRAIGDRRTYTQAYVATLAAVSHTFREQSRRVGTTAATARRTRSFVFALNLDRLDVASYAGTDGKTDLATGGYSQTIQTMTHTQGVDGGKVLLLGFGILEPSGDSGQRYYQSRVQVDGVDAFSADGTSDTYTGTNIQRFFYPGSGMTAQNWPWLHVSLETLADGAHTVAWQGNISADSAGRGVKAQRLLALSLEADPAVPAPGGGGKLPPSRIERRMYQNDYSAARRRIYYRLVDATDDKTPETGEAGGQPFISKNGAAFSSSGVGVLVGVDTANGLYYSEVTAAVLSDLGSIQPKYKSAATALFMPQPIWVEELPWLDDGTAQSGGASTITRRSGAPALAPGSIIRLVGGTGAGLSQLVLTDAAPVSTMEQPWTTAPDATSVYVVVPGLPPTTPSVNMTQIGGSAPALAAFLAGALSLKTFTVVAGTLTTTQFTCDLPITVAGVATPANFYKDRTVYFTTGKLAGEEALITASAVSGANTLLTVDILTAAPVAGATGVVA